MEPLLPSHKPRRPAKWLQHHPVASAALYMLLGGGIVYFYLAGRQQQQAQQLYGLLPGQAGAAAVAAAAPAPGSVKPLQQPEEPAICTDTCFKAKDGVCDDGRFLPNMTRSLGSLVLCDLGSDCADCGPWKGRQHSKAWTEAVGPVEFVRRHNLTMLVRRSSLEPKFHMAYTDPAHDHAVSHNFNGLGSIEARLSHVAYHVLHGPCQKQGGGLMLDVGANFGYYSLMAGMMGCRVIAWEPVTTFRAFMEYGIARNRLHNSIELRPAAVGMPGGRSNVTVVAPQRGVWGTASIDGRNIDHGIDNQGPYHKFNVSIETLDQVLLPPDLPQQEAGTPATASTTATSSTSSRQQVALLKLDVEGLEPAVIAGAARLLQRGEIDNVLLEYAPWTAEKINVTEADRAPRMLLALLAAGFKIGHIDTHDYFHRDIASLSEPLETLPAVTETNLKFDIFDTLQLTEVGFHWLREPCREMAARQLISHGLPERLHPKSFRSSFEVNTHVWASRLPAYVPYLSGPPVGAFPSERKLTDSWFVPEWSDRGLGGRSCKGIREVAVGEAGLTPAGRAAMVISNRCRCGTALPCEAEEKVADECAQSGRTPFSDDPDFVPD